MPSPSPDPKPGRKPKPENARTLGERQLAKIESAVTAQKRRIGAEDRAFIRLYADGDFLDADKAALEAGFKTPGIGEKLVARLSKLIEAERMRRSVAMHMTTDEALRILASIVRNPEDQKVQHAALVTVLRVNGMLTDKPLPPAEKRALAGSVGEMIAELRALPGARLRLRAVERDLAVEAEISPANSETGAETEDT